MKTLTDVGVMSVTDVGPRLDNHSGRSFTIASYRFMALAETSCTLDNWLRLEPDSPVCGADAQLAESATASANVRKDRNDFTGLVSAE